MPFIHSYVTQHKEANSKILCSGKMVDCCIQVTVEPVLLYITGMLNVNGLPIYVQIAITNCKWNS